MIGNSLGQLFKTPMDMHLGLDQNVITPDVSIDNNEITPSQMEQNQKGIEQDLTDPNLGGMEVSQKFTPPAPDYDMAGWQKATGLTSLPEGQHYPDTYKLPNHMTFSDDSIYNGVNGNQGGRWEKLEGDPDHDWKFTPGKTNLENHTPDELKSYFNSVEPRSILDLSTPQ